MKITNIVSAIFALLGINAIAATFTSAPKVDTIADLTNRVVSTSSTTTTPYVEVARFASDRSYWPETRLARFVPGSTATIRHGCVEPTSTGSGRWIFDDCFDERPLDIRWTGGESVLLTGLTNRFTASFIPIDSMPAWEAARDLKSELGGGVIKFEYGEYRFGSDTTPGSFVLKPNIGVSGQFGGPMGDEAHEGTYAQDKVARTMIGTKFHIYNAGTNGAGFPAVVASAKYVPAYTNSPIASFVDANSEWVSYNRGGNFIENIGFFGSWDWPWNGTNYPGASLVIDEVAGMTLRNVYFGPSPGPAIWARGAFGLRCYDFFMDTPLTPAVVIVDTSDTKWSRGSIAAARGAAFSFTGELRTNGTYQATANTHIIDDVDVWNNTEELVGWVGTSQVTTNYTVVESSGVPRTGWSVDTVTDLFGVTNRMGSDTGLPVMVRGTNIPGGLNTNAVYYVRWGSAGGTNFYLHNTSGSAIRGTSPIDITSTGTDWWLEAPAAQVFARDAEEIKIDGMRADQSFSGVGDFTRISRVLISGLFAWEIGLNQTETRQSRKQTFRNPDIIGIRLENVNSFNMSGSSLIGSKGNSGLSTPWIHNSYGIVGIGVTDSKISGLFDRLNTGIYFDASSGNVDADGAAFGSWVSKPIEATDGYGVISHVPYFNGNTNSQIVATLGSAFTNITGDFSIALKAQVPTATTNGWANGRHSALVNLTSVTNTTAYGALVTKSAALSFWRSPVDNSINLVTTLGGTNYDPTIPSTERFAVGADVTPFIGKTIEIVYQRRNGVIEMYIEGQLKQQAAINNSTTGGIYAPYFLMGQVGDSGQFSHPQAPIYGVIFHRNSFTKSEINNGTPWTRHGGTNAVLYWDFNGASLAAGVKDWSGNGHDGVVQQIGAVAPSFGTTRDYNLIAGSGITISRTGARQFTITSSYTDESIQDLVAGMLVAGSNISLSYNDSGNQLTINGPTDEYMQDLVASLLVAGSNITLSYDDVGNQLTINSTASGGGGLGTNVFLNNLLIQPARFTNNASVTGGIVWGTNANGHIVGYATNVAASGGGTAYTFTNTDGNIVLTLTSGTNLQINLNTNIAIDTLSVGTIIFSNAVGVASGGTGLSNITSEAYLVGQGTNALRAVGPTTTGLAGWSNGVAVPYTAGSGITLSGGLISATGGTNLSTVLVSNTPVVNPNFVADTNTVVSVTSGTNIAYKVRDSGVTPNTYSNANITVGADGRIIAASNGTAGTGGGTNTFVISTNNLGYVERNGAITNINEGSGEVVPWTITIPANTLGVDGDEVQIHFSGILTVYSSGGDNGYSWKVVSDSSVSPATVAELSTTNRYFASSGDPAYGVDWNVIVKRNSSNTLFVTTSHRVGYPAVAFLNATNAGTNYISTTFAKATSISGDLGTDPIDFSFYFDIADDTRAANLALYGYLVHKVGSLGQSNYITSVSSDFQVSGGALSLTNTTGTGAIVRQSAAGSGSGVTNLSQLSDVTGASPATNSLLVGNGTKWTSTNSPTIDGTVSVTGTNYAMLFLADGSSSTNPPGVTIRPPDVVQTNYSLILPSNGVPGVAMLSSLNSTTLVVSPVTKTGNNGYALLETNTGNGLFFGAVSGGSGGGGDVYTSSNNVFTGSNAFSDAVMLGTTNIATELALKATLASPAFTGDPTAPTQSLGDSDTSLATTAFAKSQAFYNETNAVAKHATLVSVEAEFIGSGSSSLELVGGSSSGSLSTSSGETSHPGIAIISTSTSATGNAYYYGTSSGLSLSNGAAGITWIIKTPSALADATETYSMRFGLNDSTSADAANGVYFRYTTNSANWIAVVREASSETSADTGLSVGASTWYKLTAVINSDATAAFFYTNGTLACSITNANVPGGTSYTRQMAHITKSAGTTARIVGIDYFKFWKEVNR